MKKSFHFISLLVLLSFFQLTVADVSYNSRKKRSTYNNKRISNDSFLQAANWNNESDSTSTFRGTKKELKKIEQELEEHDAHIFSKIEELQEILCSKIEDIAIDVNLNEEIYSQIEDLDKDLEIHDSHICSKIEDLQEVLCSKIEDITVDISLECAPIPITFTGSTIIINQPGHYCLTDGFSIGDQTGIWIQSDDVVLDLNGQTIQGSYARDVILVQAPSYPSSVNRVTIRNGIIRDVGDYGSGVKVWPTNDGAGSIGNYMQCIALKNLMLFNARIDLWKVDGGIIENCKIAQNQLKMYACKNCLVKECVVLETPNLLLLSKEITRGAAIVVPNNNLGAYGVHACHNCCFLWCKAVSNEVDGFFIAPFGVSKSNIANVFISCVSENNVNGFNVKADINFVGGTVMHTVIRDSVANNNAGAGIKISNIGSKIQIKNCSASGNLEDGFHNEGDNCELRDSTAMSNTGNGIFNSGVGFIVCNNTSHNNGDDLDGVEDSNICHIFAKICSKLEILQIDHEELLLGQDKICSKIEQIGIIV